MIWMHVVSSVASFLFLANPLQLYNSSVRNVVLADWITLIFLVAARSLPDLLQYSWLLVIHKVAAHKKKKKKKKKKIK